MDITPLYLYFVICILVSSLFNVQHCRFSLPQALDFTPTLPLTSKILARPMNEVCAFIQSMRSLHAAGSSNQLNAVMYNDQRVHYTVIPLHDVNFSPSDFLELKMVIDTIYAIV